MIGEVTSPLPPDHIDVQVCLSTEDGFFCQRKYTFFIITLWSMFISFACEIYFLSCFNIRGFRYIDEYDEEGLPDCDVDDGGNVEAPFGGQASAGMVEGCT